MSYIMIIQTSEGKQANESNGQDDDGDVEDSVYISVELTDFADYPILDKHDALEIENLDSDRPILRIGEYVLYGTYEDALGTDLYYDMPPLSESTTDAAAATCVYAGSATKRLKFVIDPNEKRQFLRKPSKV
ncbi:hypothetical protein H310_07901 [Aphanomyces invadans]|uniref:Transcription factor TFIIIC triple barrel domain-containing protein n=1 Tax=Aphanomyces invadans TaxID=157072 RepID=A0A024U1V8_9STRA|nr:hypothetical protein H310_07901 [Aphanomyces invadans]ETV99866.1 hypothetical protein H310_07901 [Aphanomyces invadans]|eukprot:XP_008871642.1 hypothetical protein H310_07901 [Aphanomyces invadans]